MINGITPIHQLFKMIYYFVAELIAHIIMKWKKKRYFDWIEKSDESRQTAIYFSNTKNSQSKSIKSNHSIVVYSMFSIFPIQNYTTIDLIQLYLSRAPSMRLVDWQSLWGIRFHFNQRSNVFMPYRCYHHPSCGRIMISISSVLLFTIRTTLESKTYTKMLHYIVSYLWIHSGRFFLPCLHHRKWYWKIQ